MRDYRRYEVWRKSYAVTLALYRLTRKFPADERFGLTSQMRRAAVSIPSNFAEGMSRRSERDRARFVYMAVGSANELEVQLELSADLDYLGRDSYKSIRDQLREVRRMLVGLIRALERTAG